eukprot:CAMPEP_0170507924 /NCGR_PEP_ID=MMETSP0208-20121228/60599_1 /TAXON_ID=197538 /ORGANISM="Strombidium inclinatum, Strain S3" /LENGTH=117 /DNA_ID=CAMNT_0010790477 /DNA_START=51 /DNA_END=404 /DNA_ORIENTATION=-
METDELRKEETKFMVAGCQLEREKQLIDRKMKYEQQIVEEQVYAKLWLMDYDKKIQREQEEAVEKKKKASDTLQVLQWQNDQRVQEKGLEKTKQAAEQRMLKAQWNKENEADKEADR